METMTMPELTAEMSRAGVSLAVREGELVCRARKGVLTPAMRATIIEHKAALTDHLERHAYLSDPRPDLAEDHDLWYRLLTRACGIDGEAVAGLFNVLHGLRCRGAELVATEAGAKLRPGEMDPGEYADLRERWLQGERSQYGQQLMEMLRQLGQVQGESPSGAWLA